jgi:hypothetical protein
MGLDKALNQGPWAWRRRRGHAAARGAENALDSGAAVALALLSQAFDGLQHLLRALTAACERLQRGCAVIQIRLKTREGSPRRP